MANSPKDFLPIIAGIFSEPEPTNEARQSAIKLNSDPKTQNEERSEGVKFYELDDKEDVHPTGNDPIPQVTMPSFKKRVHSQRIPQHERAAVTPYEGSYDEKYSSDEENVEYEVCEPEDLTERSNSTVTFSEDIYDSDAIDEMIKNQIRKSSQLSQDSPVKDEAIQNISDSSKPTKSILKDAKSKTGKKDSLPLSSPDAQPLSPQSKVAQKAVSSQQIISEGIIGEESAKASSAATSGVIKKDDEKGEKPNGKTDKETSIKGERDIVTKSLQSTIPEQIDQITDSSATNKNDFAASGEKLLIKPLQDSVEKEKDASKAAPEKDSVFSTTKKSSEDLKTSAFPTDLKPDGFDSKPKQSVDAASKPDNERGFTHGEPSQKLDKEFSVSKGRLSTEAISPTREEAAKTAMEFIDNITKSVQEIFPEISKKAKHDKLEDTLEKSCEPTNSVTGIKFIADQTTPNEQQKQLKDHKISSVPVSEAGLKLTDGEHRSEIPEISKDKDNQIISDPPGVVESIMTEIPKSAVQKHFHKDIEKGTEEILKTEPAEDLNYKEKKFDTDSHQDKIELNKTEKETKEFDGKDSKTDEKASIPVTGDLSETVTDITEKLTQSIITDSTTEKDLAEELSCQTLEGNKKIDTVSSKYGTKEDSSKPADVLILESFKSADNKKDTENSPVEVASVSPKNESEINKSSETAGLVSDVQTSSDELKADEKLEEETKPRVIFRIDSEDELLSDADDLPPSNVSSPTEGLSEKLKREIKENLEKDKLDLEERLTSLKGNIFDISEKSLSKTKELVDERLRKISEIKPPQELEEPVTKEKPVRAEEIKIGRFHITPTLVEEVIRRTKEHEIAEKLKTARANDEIRDEVEKELPEKLTEADLEEVIRELKKEGLKTDVYLQSEDVDKEEKKDRTLKRVERRFERMASETLEKDKESGVSEEKLNEKREIEFQQMLSNLSNEELAEYQQEYLQLCEEGGLSSLTPTEDWESRDPDTPENELDDDSPRKSESFQGSHGVGETGEPVKSSSPKNSLKSPTNPPKHTRISDETSKTQPLTPVDSSHVGSSPSDVDPTSGFVSERSDDIPTYGERKKFWEQMSSSHSSETANDLPRGSISSVESIEIEKMKDIEDHYKISPKVKFDKQVPDSSKKSDESGLVKSLTESYSKKIAAGELIMPAMPRPKLPSKESPEYERPETVKLPDSSDTAVVSELELKLKSRGSSASITEEPVIPGSTELKQKKLESTTGSLQTVENSEKEDVFLPLSERKKIFQPLPLAPVRSSIQERSMSLPVAELPVSIKAKTKSIQDDIRKEIIIENILSQEEPASSQMEEKSIEKKVTPDIEEAAANAMTELLSKGVKIAEEALRNKEKAVIKESTDLITKTVETLKESHEEKNETEGNEKEKVQERTKLKMKENEGVPSITVTTTGKKHLETGSVGESEDTQSESDFTPEEIRVMDNGDAHWDESGTQSGGFSPKESTNYPKELGETGIGRWIGQEDLSKQSWDKDDLDSSHFKIQTKWERSRSEGTSPKEHYVCTPEERYPDTVWEVPVQEQLEKEEITHDIPIEKQVIIEKDEEEYEEEEETKVKLTEDEAKEIAEEILEYIQFEVENRSSFLVNDSEETSEGVTQAQVTDYLRHLAGEKEFDDQDVQLIESILAKKQKTQFWKSQSVDTAGCSVDITDEELRTSEIDNDISPVESQITKLQNLEQTEDSELCMEEFKIEDDALKKTTDNKKMLDQAIVKEPLEKAQETIEKDDLKKMENFERKIDESEFDSVIQKEHESVEDTIRTKEIEQNKYFADTEKVSAEKPVFDEVKGDTEKTAEGDRRSESTEIQKSYSKIQKPITSEIKMESEELKNLEISVPESMVIRKLGDQIYSSEDSPRSTSLEESRGEEVLSSSSSVEKQGDAKLDVVFRHSSSAFLKADRRSGTDLEFYSSSGESHCHSFEQTSSRPCSSDVEGLLAGNVGTTGSSEYESAISHEISSKQPTSTDYQTAVSSLSSRESIKSLDSESSGHLASVEVSSEASETLIPSALELDRDIEAPGTMSLDDDGSDFGHKRKTGHPTEYKSQISAPAAVNRPADEDFEIISESEVASWAGEVSEDEEAVAAEEALSSEEHAQKMKRSHEMTFQPEPKPIVFSESLDGLSKDSIIEKGSMGLSIDENSSIISAPDEKFGSSLEESGSVLSMSLSTTSEPSAMRTVIELSHTDSEKIDGSLSASVSSTHSALDTPTTPQPQVLTNEMSTSTTTSGLKKKTITESVTITTSSSDVQGVPCVSTQVTSVSRKSSTADESKSESESQDLKPLDLSHANGPTQVEYVADYDEIETTKTKKSQGHRRKESTSNFVPTMTWNINEAKMQNVRANITEAEEEYGSDKYVYDITLTEKEVKNDEKKEADDSEGFEEQDKKFSEQEEIEAFKGEDSSRPQSQISKTDSESGRQPISSVYSEDQPDSELSELMKQGSSETEKEDPLERPTSPEPEEMENKDITPEFSSEAQASVTELEMEYSGAYSRRDEYASHVSPIREEKSDLRSKESSEEYPGIEKISDGLVSQTSLESTVAEKHELESGEKENLQSKLKEKSTSNIPDITVTEHRTPVSHQKFQYPEPNKEVKEKKSTSKTPDTPASTSSRTSSSSTDQGKEYSLDEAEIRKFPKEVLSEEKEVSETKDEKESLDSPSSDSFEMLDKPDISDEFVIIEEVGREAQENDQEGKSIQITSKKKKPPKKVEEDQDVILSPPAPATKMTDLKYYPSEDDSELFSFDSDSPPQPTTRKFVEKLKRKSSKEEKDELEYEQQLEQNKKWLETQFRGEQAAKIVGAYGYEMEFERAPLEDIKEEDLNELDSSSKIGSMGSQKESLGSFGSVKDSFSSTPDYDVLAGRKFFTRSGDHDDVSMSSLQEFELIEKKLMENGKKSGSSSSQDSLSSKKLGTSSKSGQDDVSSGSLKEFETLENACTTVVNMEKKAKQEEAILSEIDEGHESQISESESCETVSAVIREKIEFDTEDFDKKMFEIDEIIRQAQSNVEKFSEMQAFEKIETIGRGDSYEEVAKVPDLELDMPLSGKSAETPASKQIKSSKPYSTQVVTKKKVEEWRAAEKTEQLTVDTSSEKTVKRESAKRSELLENGGKIKSVSADSLEIQTTEKQIIQEGKEDTISLDSYRRKSQKTNGHEFSNMSHKSDSMEEVSGSTKHHESSSGDYTFSGTDHTYRPPPRAEFMLGSSDSLDPSSSTATHATYQYETDSVMSSSFTSGDSNTMVSSTDNLDLLVSGQSVVDLAGISKTDDWLENLEVGGANPLEKKLEFDSKKSNIQKVTFSGPGAEKSLQEYLESIPQEEIVETEEVDEDGNIHIRKVLKQRVVVCSGSVKKEKPCPDKRTEQFVSETVEPLQDDTNSHIIHRRIQTAPEVQKIVFKGRDAEKALQSYLEQLNTGDQVEEVEEIDEQGNIHVKKVIRQKVVLKPRTTSENVQQEKETHTKVQKVLLTDESPQSAPKDITGEDKNVHIKASVSEKIAVESEDLKSDRLGGHKNQSAQLEIIDMGPQVQKLIFKGPNAEKALEEYAKSLKPEDDVTEVEEVDEHGNVHIKKVLRQQIIVRPNQELTEDQLQLYLSHLAKSGELEGESYSHVVQKTVDVPKDIQKIIFKGPDAEKQLQEFLKQQQPEIEEVEETDEDGNVHIKKILRQKVIVRPDRELTKDELEQYLEQLEKSESVESGTIAGLTRESRPEVQKIVFKGPNAEEQLQKFLKQQQPEIEEITETDEDGTIHIKKVLRQKVVVRPDSALTKQELEQYIQPSEPESDKSSATPYVVHSRIEMPPEVQKITFRGADAEKQLQEFLQNQKPEVEEIEETDEHGNVHIKRIIKQRVFIHPEELKSDACSHVIGALDEPRSSRILTKDELQQYLDNLDQTESLTKEEEKDEKVILEPSELTQRLLTEEEFLERLKQKQSESFFTGKTKPSDEGRFFHVIHKEEEIPPQLEKIVFKGPNAEQALKEYIETLNLGEDVEVKQEVDADGNIHEKTIIKHKTLVRLEDLQGAGLTGEAFENYFRGGAGSHVQVPDPNSSINRVLTEGFSSAVILTEKEGRLENVKQEEESSSSSAVKKESGISQRPPLVSDISMDDEAEYDTTEHDWRRQLEILHAEADEVEIEENLDAALAAASRFPPKEK